MQKKKKKKKNAQPLTFNNVSRVNAKVLQVNAKFLEGKQSFCGWTKVLKKKNSITMSL